MALSRFFAILPLVLSVLVGCGPSSPAEGSIESWQLAVHIPESLPGEVSRVTVTVSASDMASRSADLVLADGVWGGVISSLPVGEHRTFLAQAFDAANTLRYQGRAEDVTVAAGTPGLVTLTLQEVSVPPPLSNEAPIIDSVVVSSTTVLPGRGLSLKASAHDPNSGDPLSFAWTAPSGSFSTPTQASTLWTAPGATGTVSLTLTVSDSQGASVSMSLTVEVVTSSGGGAVAVRVVFSGDPRVTSLTSTQSRLDVGQQTLLIVSVSNEEGAVLHYQWSATCAGSFSDPTLSGTRFIPSARPGTACNNCQVRVVVTDGHGGQATGIHSLCVAPPLTSP